MPISNAKEFLKYVLYFYTFLQELPIALAEFLVEIFCSKLAQRLLRTYHTLIIGLLLDF